MRNCDMRARDGSVEGDNGGVIGRVKVWMGGLGCVMV